MKIILFTHPSFMKSQSMPRFATWIATGMRERGHEVSLMSPAALLSRLPAPASLKKWLGYLDQYVVFPRSVKRAVRKESGRSLFVFADNALGPWVPAVAAQPHTIHCHDLLAQFSALGKIPRNPTGYTGRKYQAFIRRGLAAGKNFICISNKTRDDLRQLPGINPARLDVVYNGLTRDFRPASGPDAIRDLRKTLGNQLRIDLSGGFVLHVGGNQWYKNRSGIVEIYKQWRSNHGGTLPLVLIGPAPSDTLQRTLDQAPDPNIHIRTGQPDDVVMKAYQAATVLLFPSIAEGFGWPIAEAQASGIPVITTAAAPMNEVGGDAAVYVSPMNEGRPGESDSAWAASAAVVLNRVVSLGAAERAALISNGLQNVKRFNGDLALDQIEQIYLDILNTRP